MPKLVFASILALASLAALPSAEAQSWITIAVPDAYSSYASAINDNGDVTGDWQGATGIHGYIRAADGTYTTFDPPGSFQTYPDQINLAGTVTGSFEGPSFSYLGFVRSADGTIASFAVPNTLATTPSGLNGAGQIVGSYELENGEYAFERAIDGTITAFAAGPAYAINDPGFITGVMGPVGTFLIQWG